MPVGFLGPKIIACRKGMACVHADAQSFLGFSHFQYLSQMLQSITQTCSLAGRHLQQDFHTIIARPLKDPIERIGYPPQPFLFTVPNMGSRMHHQIGDPQKLCSFQFLEKSTKRFSRDMGAR